MKYICLLSSLLLLSCVSIPNKNVEVEEELVENEPEKSDNFARVSFANYYIDDIYVRLKQGNAEHNIGTINLNEYGQSERLGSLIPSGKTAEYIISPGHYTIILKKDENGRFDADGNNYEEFYFPSSKESFIIHLFPQHERNTTAVILFENAQTISYFPLNPLFKIEFNQDMIQPIVENNTELVDDEDNIIEICYQWQTNRKLTIYPKNFLRPSTSYSVVVQVEARNTECERIIETVKFPFTTGIFTELISPLDLSSITKDTSNSGYIRLDWTLPAGANGSEIHIISGEKIEKIDLYAKPHYTFSNEDTESVTFNILPYRIINGGKAYHQTDVERSEIID